MLNTHATHTHTHTHTHNNNNNKQTNKQKTNKQQQQQRNRASTFFSPQGKNMQGMREPGQREHRAVTLAHLSKSGITAVHTCLKVMTKRGARRQHSAVICLTYRLYRQSGWQWH